MTDTPPLPPPIYCLVPLLRSHNSDFRFQLPLEGGDYIWLDVNDIDATGPSNRHLCQLDTLASSL